MGFLGNRSAFGLIGLLLAAGAQAETTAAPECLAYGRALPVNNSQVLHWKRTTKNQFRERGNIQGTVTEILADRNGHAHFVIQIGKQKEDTIEVIYNEDFGKMPTPKIGAQVQACGDYITSTAQSGPYPASPAGAIIHWVHMNPSGRGHDAGFTMVDGVLYGMDAEHAGPRRNEPPRNKKKRRQHRQREYDDQDVQPEYEESLEATFNF
jgi:hypothetical protein